MAKFTTLSRAREYCMVQEQGEDAIIDRLITSCTALMQTYMNRKILKQEFTERFDGTGNNFYVLKNYPVISVSSLFINKSPYTSYDFDKDQIILSYGFPRGRSNCEVTYIAGYDVVPDDIEQACLEFVAFKYNQRKHIDLASKAIAGETTSFIGSDIPAFIKVVLNQYKKVF